MITIRYLRYVPTLTIDGYNRNIFKEVFDHETPVRDIATVKILAGHWLEDHYGHVDAILDDEVMLIVDNKEKCVKELEKIGLQIVIK